VNEPRATASDQDLEARRNGNVSLEPEHLTDLGNARRLVALYGKDFRYLTPDGPFLAWDNARFADDSGEIQLESWAKETVVAMYPEAAYSYADDEAQRRALIKHATQSESARALRAMVTLARSEPGIPVRPEQLDADPWALNVLNGTLDLRSQELRPHRREDLITKLVPVNYEPTAACPTWCAFLDRVLDGNPKLIGFMRRYIGYALTGSTREQALAMAYGQGANGKTTLLRATISILGDYSQSVPMDTFMASRHADTARPDLARLRGARLVAAVESESGRRFAEALVKQLTGGDVVVARRLYREHFEFMPVFKLIIATNHRPTIRGTDTAIWRRVHLVPFTITIPPEERDPELPDKLLEERAGILAWAVEGCAEWQRIGLDPPEDVRAATDAYRKDMDVLGGFISERCTVGPQASATAGALYESYITWAHKAGEKPASQRAFGLALTERGFVPDRHGKEREREWRGIGLAEVLPF
jgi:putative DNA primase/helicase